jgi:5'-3' exonuclease
MGVPGFFAWLLKNYKKDGFVFQKEKLEKLNKLLDKVNNIDYFLIDTNCLIHPVCFKVVADNPEIFDNDVLESKMFVSIIEYIEKIIKYVNPTKGIYIAIDGVAPAAKIKQQRTRRFKSVADKQMWDSIKKKHGEPLTSYWNNNAVTPGTDFMLKLHNVLLEWSENYNMKNNKIVYYSSCFTPAEGEHKLLQFIKDKNDSSSYSIYGLDADLIFLALASNAKNIYLLREADQMDKRGSNEAFNYVNIDVMKDSIFETVVTFLKKQIDKMQEEDLDDEKRAELYKPYGFENLNKNNIINDFIFMCYFLGNDFLPHIPSLDIHNNGIEYLIKCYAKTMNELILANNSITYMLKDSNKEIKFEFFVSFITKLGADEEYVLKELVKGRKRVRTDAQSEYLREVFKIENLQFKIDDPIKLGYDTPEMWRARYYKHYWNIDSDKIEEFSENLVKEYLVGIKWVTLYYFDKCPSWSWYYPYNNPPFISDIAKYMKNINDIKFNDTKPLLPFVQLLSVLPPQSSFLLPKSLQKLITNPKSSIISLYPLKFEQDFINKTRHWMGVPILPPLDIKRIVHSYRKYEDEITKDESIKNQTMETFIFNKKIYYKLINGK